MGPDNYVIEKSTKNGLQIQILNYLLIYFIEREGG